MQRLLIVLFVFLCGTINAQQDIRPCRVIMAVGDTVDGSIDFRGDVENSKQIRFQNTELDTVFKPFEIAGYISDNQKYYTSRVARIEGDTLNIFAEYLVKGEKDLFYFRTASGFHYAISISEHEIVALPYSVETVTVDGEIYIKESKRFIGYLKAYYADCPELFDRIDRLPSPNKNALVSITKAYNDIMCGEGSCILYSKKKNNFRMAIEPIYSFNLSGYTNKNGEVPNSVGGLLYFWIPSSNERLYIKTGCMYIERDYGGLYTVPFQFEYRVPYKIIQPKFDLGINICLYDTQPEMLMALASAGFLVKCTSWLFLDFDVSADIVAFVDHPKLFPDFSIRTGLYLQIGSKKKE